jgi:16S rRNA processing protein RimM
MAKPDQLLEVGKVGRAHGVRGDVFLDLTTDRVERAAVGSRLWIRDEWRSVERSHPSNNRWRVHLTGVDDRTAAEALTGAIIYAEPIVDPDEIWVHQLIGARVVEASGIERGTCVSVIDNPAADLLELDSGALVPANFVTGIDNGADEVTVTIEPPDGLFDLGEDR